MVVSVLLGVLLLLGGFDRSSIEEKLDFGFVNGRGR